MTEMPVFVCAIWKKKVSSLGPTLAADCCALVVAGTAGKPIAESRAHTVPNRIVGIISNLERSALEEWLNSEELHRPQAADGSTLICLNSLLAYVRKTKAT